MSHKFYCATCSVLKASSWGCDFIGFTLSHYNTGRFFEIHFKIKNSDKILRRFDLAEIIFKFKKMNKTLHIRGKITRENMKSD